MLRRDFVFVGQENSTFDGTLELPHISRPGVFENHALRIRRKSLRSEFGVLFYIRAEEMLSEKNRILSALSRGGTLSATSIG